MSALQARSRPPSAVNLDVAAAFPSRTWRRGLLGDRWPAGSIQPNVTRASRKAPSGQGTVRSRPAPISAAAIASVLRPLPRNLLALLTRFRQADGNGLSATLHSAAAAASAASRGAALVTVHLAFHIAARATGISALPSLGHVLLLQHIASR